LHSLLFYPHLFALFLINSFPHPRYLHSFPTRRSSDLAVVADRAREETAGIRNLIGAAHTDPAVEIKALELGAIKVGVSVETTRRSEEHTSELQSLRHLVCRLLLEKKKKNKI